MHLPADYQRLYFCQDVFESISPSLISKQGNGYWRSCDGCTGFTPQEGVGRAIVVITDGENHEGGAVEAAKVAAEKGIQVSVLGGWVCLMVHLFP